MNLAGQSQPEVRNLVFAPQPDITTWELTMILPILMGHPMTPEHRQLIGDGMRHFSELVPQGVVLQKQPQAPVVASSIPEAIKQARGGPVPNLGPKGFA